MADQVLPSKLIGERITVLFDFRDELEWGDTISSGSLSVYTAVGVDNTPQEMLYLGASVGTTSVSQKIHKGLPGVIYKIVCSVTTVAGHIINKDARLAVLPDVSLVPPILADFYTTPPYPLEVAEQLTSESELVAQYSNANFHQEQVGSAAELNFITLYGSIEAYTAYQEDQLTSGASCLGGNIYGGLETYQAPPEDFIQSGAVLLGGEFFGGFVEYNAPAEDFIQSSATVVGGSIT